MLKKIGIAITILIAILYVCMAGAMLFFPFLLGGTVSTISPGWIALTSLGMLIFGYMAYLNTTDLFK